MSTGCRGNFSAKPSVPLASTSIPTDIWYMKFTEEGDQYWYNSVTNECNWEVRYDDSNTKNRIMQISSPYSVVHNQSWSNLLSLDLQNLILSENTKIQLLSSIPNNNNNNNSGEDINSTNNNNNSSIHRSKMDIFTNTFRPKSKRMSMGPAISSPFNIRKNTESIHLNSSSINNLTYPSSSSSSLRRSISLSPNSIRKSLQQQEEEEQEPVVSAPFNLKYEWGLKVKTSNDNKIV